MNAGLGHASFTTKYPLLWKHLEPLPRIKYEVLDICNIALVTMYKYGSGLDFNSHFPCTINALGSYHGCSVC